MIQSNHSEKSFFRTPPLRKYDNYCRTLLIPVCSEFIWVLLKKHVHSRNSFYRHASICMIIHAMFLSDFDNTCDTSSHKAQLKGTLAGKAHPQQAKTWGSFVRGQSPPLSARYPWWSSRLNQAALFMPGWSSSGGRAGYHDTQGELHLSQDWWM